MFVPGAIVTPMPVGAFGRSARTVALTPGCGVGGWPTPPDTVTSWYRCVEPGVATRSSSKLVDDVGVTDATNTPSRRTSSSSG